MTDTISGSYADCKSLLQRRLAEQAPGRIQLLTGPRQVGKTTLLLELADKLGDVAIYVASDGPEAALPGFKERLWQRLLQVTDSQGRGVLLLDEAQLLPDWAAWLKAEWDRARRRRHAIHVVATGSSALKLASGSRESMAGRFERITLTHWNAAALMHAFGLTREAAALTVVRHGGYPGAMDYREDVARWSAYVRDSIVEPAIGRDILALGSIRKPALLRQVFAVCASAPAQIVSLQKMQGQLQDAGALETIAHYLALLGEAYLIAALPKYSQRSARRRAAPPKLVALNNALLAVTDPRGIPDPEKEPGRLGVWVENACLAHAVNSGQRVMYWREEPIEVDAVIDGSWGKFAVEVKTGSAQLSDFTGLLEFSRRHKSYTPLVIGDRKTLAAARRVGVDAVTWQDYLVQGLSHAHA